MRASRRVVAALLVWPAGACAPPAGAAIGAGAPQSPPSLPAVRPDSGDLIPVGLGHLKQDEISIKLDLTSLTVTLLPVEESVIRVVAPDSYRTLHKLVMDKAPDIERGARVHGLRERHVWMVRFVGLAAGAVFNPGDVTITQSGREFRPLEIYPLSTRFGSRLNVTETQSALYLFDDGLDVAQPLTVAMGAVQSTDWEGISRVIEREKAAIRGRRGG
jgi:hypothetical protein